MNWRDDIVSATVVDEKAVPSGKPLDVVTVHGGINGGKPNGVYIGLDEKNPVVAYVDLSDADRQNLTYTVYGNAERIDTEAYVGATSRQTA